MTFEEQFEQLQKMFDSSDCDIEVLPPDEEKAKKLRAKGGEFTPLAAILAGTGGVSVNGILRFLGSEHNVALAYSADRAVDNAYAHFFVGELLKGPA